MFNGFHNRMQAAGNVRLWVLAGWIMLSACNVGLAIAVSLSGIV